MTVKTAKTGFADAHDVGRLAETCQRYDLKHSRRSGKAVAVNVLADGKVLKKERQRKAT
jgi:hypothetical protein